MCVFIGLLISFSWIGYGYADDLTTNEFLVAGKVYAGWNDFSNILSEYGYENYENDFNNSQCGQYWWVDPNPTAIYSWHCSPTTPWFTGPSPGGGIYIIIHTETFNSPPQHGCTYDAYEIKKVGRICANEDSDGDGIMDNVDENPNGFGELDSADTKDKELGIELLKKPIQCPQNFKGNPINIFNGNNLEQETDFAFNSPFEGGLTFKRYYNSQSASDSTIGFGWTHNYDLVLYPDFNESNLLIKIVGGTGKGYYFEDFDEDGIFKGAFAENSSIIIDPDDNYIWNRDDGTIYKFDQITGQLLSITNKTDNVQLLSYNTDNLLETVSDQATGRSLTFHYNSDKKIASISGPVTPSVPDGIWVSYTYDANNNLTGVQYADDGNGSPSSGFEYLYEDTNDPNNLTGKKDLASHLLSTWIYNENDQTIENVNNKGTGATINYDNPDEVAVTTVYGITTNYHITQVAGRKKIIMKSNADGCTSCSDGIYKTDFDESTGFPTKREFFNGRIDLFQDYDENYNPQTMIKSQGTFEEKTIQKTYHPTLSFPLTITEKSLFADTSNPDRNKIAIYDYDDPNDPSDTNTPNENPSNLVHRLIEQGFTLTASGQVIACEHITAMDYNDKGQIISIDGPLPGIDDTILYAYDANTCDLTSVSIPVTGTITFEYDSAGNMVRFLDQNNIETIMTYDGRNRQMNATTDGKTSGTGPILPQASLKA